jgi:hypothetical protein
VKSPQLLTQGDLARILDVSVRTIQRREAWLGLTKARSKAFPRRALYERRKVAVALAPFGIFIQ